MSPFFLIQASIVNANDVFFEKRLGPDFGSSISKASGNLAKVQDPDLATHTVKAGSPA